MGCCLCANMLANLEKTGQDGRHKVLKTKLRRYNTKWARYEINTLASMQAAAVWKHSSQAIHKRSISFFMAPSNEPLTSWLAPEGDERLLAGCVPQPADWLRCWRYTVSPTSFAKASKLSATEDFILAPASRKRPVRDKTFRSMVNIMAEVERQRSRDVLKKSKHATFACDDKGDYRALRVKVSYEAPDGTIKSEIMLLGVLYKGGRSAETTLQDFDKDSAEKFQHSLKIACERFCTPLGETVDRDLLEQLNRIVITASGDGLFCLQKALRSLASSSVFPKVTLIIRDACHAIRIATRDPLRYEERFGEHWKTVFEDFIPSFQNSGHLSCSLGIEGCVCCKLHVFELRSTNRVLFVM